MGIPKKAFVLSSAVITLLTSRYAPNLAVYPNSFFWNAATLLFVQLLAKFCWVVLVYPFFFSPLRRLPQPPGANIFLGHFLSIFKLATGEPQRHWVDTVPNDGVIYYRTLFNSPRVLVTSPKALAEVLVQRSYEFIKPEQLRLGLGRILGVGILLAEGDEHKRQRRSLMPAFAFRHIKDLYPVFWSKSREMTDAIFQHIKSDPHANSVVEIREWSSRATLDLIGVAGMGQDFHAIADPSNELYMTYRNIFTPGRGARILQLMNMLVGPKIMRLLPFKRNEEIREAMATIQRVARQLIQSKRAQLEKGGRTDLDILSVAIESGGFSDDDLVNQLMTFLAAGHETTASALTWAVYLLCKFPEVQTRLRNEINAAVPELVTDPNFQVTSTVIDSISYLNAVLNEVTRLFPPVALTMRQTAHATTIQGHFVPANTTVIICPWATNVSEQMWGPDAKDFNPDRWMGPGRANTGGADSNFAVTTFLHGPRSCIGMQFAKAEFACLLACLVGRFEMELADPDMELRIQSGITVTPKGGLQVKLRPVEGSH